MSETVVKNGRLEKSADLRDALGALENGRIEKGEFVDWLKAKPGVGMKALLDMGNGDPLENDDIAEVTQAWMRTLTAETAGSRGQARDRLRREVAISKERFKTHAQPIDLSSIFRGIMAQPREFSSGSYGFFANGQVDVVVDGISVPLTYSLNLPVMYSKPENKPGHHHE